jgi:hypothetical protein
MSLLLGMKFIFIYRKTAFFIVTAVTTSNLTIAKISHIAACLKSFRILDVNVSEYFI